MYLSVLLYLVISMVLFSVQGKKIAFFQEVNDVCMHTYYIYLILIVQLTQELQWHNDKSKI